MEHDAGLGWHLTWWSALCLAVMWLAAHQVSASWYCASDSPIEPGEQAQ